MGSTADSWGLSHLAVPSDRGDKLQLDVVAVHGYRGHRKNSWTANSGRGPCWLDDFLPQDIPVANIYSFGYPANSTIESAAQDLIRELDDARMLRRNFDIPIAFVAHHFGGLVVEQEALILLASFRERSQTRILANTVSLLFFAVPHRRAFSDYNKYLLKIAGSVSLGDLRGGENLIPTERELRTMIQGFAPISNQFRIYTFCDRVATPGGRQQGLGDVLNYYMGLPNEELLHVNASQADMTKFSSNKNADYLKIVAILRRTALQNNNGTTLGDNDRRADQVFRLDGLESENGKQWFMTLKSDAHRVIGSRPMVRRARVAIIDSGIDWSNPHFREHVREDLILAESFVDGLEAREDADGHGTHSAHLVLKVAPSAKLFIARVYEHGAEKEFDENIPAIVKAIRWAITQRVDIISISFGYRVENEHIKAALRDAFHASIIIFAAASNSGINPRNPISFPANMRQVICIHSSDGDGNPSPYNPPPTPDCNFAILGEAVAAAWPQGLDNDRSDNLRVASGSSVATPIAAGLAALIIEYAWQGGPTSMVVTQRNKLRHSDEMRKLFRSITRDRDGYQSIAPSMLFDYHGEQMHQRVSGKISEVLDTL